MKILLRKPLIGWLLISTYFFSGCIQIYNKPGWGSVQSMPVPAKAYRLGSPEWSPDGSSIVFISREFVHPAEYVDLIVYDLAANETITLSEDNDFAPIEVHWSPDQSLIAGDFDGLKWIDTNSGNVIREFETGFVSAAGWSPSGNFFTITWLDELNNIALTDYGANGSEKEISVFRVETRQLNGIFGGVSISSNYIFASTSSRHQLPGFLEDGNIIVMNHEGKFISSLGTETTDDIDPSVYPGNEEWLVYLARSENVSIIFTNLSGTCEYDFGTSERFVTGIDFSPDGDKLAVTVEDELLVVDFENLFGESAADLISACEG